jgi:hypothetical protein
VPTKATSSGAVQLRGSAGAALYGPALITVTACLDNLNNRLLTSDETTTCADLINSGSTAIRRYCRTEFPPYDCWLLVRLIFFTSHPSSLSWPLCRLENLQQCHLHQPTSHRGCH